MAMLVQGSCPIRFSIVSAMSSLALQGMRFDGCIAKRRAECLRLQQGLLWLETTLRLGTELLDQTSLKKPDLL
jgi:hypothetical protein